MGGGARACFTYLLPPGITLCLPTMRDCILCLCIHGGLTGMPQVSMPSAAVGGAPVGLSILGARGSDATLVAVARALSIEPKA